MSLYEILGTILTVIGCLFGYHKWLMAYIDQNDTNTNKELANLINSLQNNQKALWEKSDRLSEKIIILDHTSVTESNVRTILEEYRQQSKQDMAEVKSILNTLIVGMDALKTEAAVNKALHQRGDK